MSLIKMTANTLNAIKGIPWPSMYSLDFTATLDATVAATVFPAGSVMHVSSTGTLLPGVGDAFTMPMFSICSSDDPDILNYGGDATADAGNWVSIEPAATGGGLTCLVATGAVELVSTNYYSGVSYAINAPLTSPTTTGSGVSAGQLTIGVYGTNTIVGVVSRGVVDNGYGTNAVAFWPVFFPV